MSCYSSTGECTHRVISGVQSLRAITAEREATHDTKYGYSRLFTAATLERHSVTTIESAFHSECYIVLKRRYIQAGTAGYEQPVFEEFHWRFQPAKLDIVCTLVARKKRGGSVLVQPSHCIDVLPRTILQVEVC